MGEEVGVDENGVGWCEGGVVGEEHLGGCLGDFADEFAAGGFGAGVVEFGLLVLVFFEAGVALAD